MTNANSTDDLIRSREIAPGVFWLIECFSLSIGTTKWHAQYSSYLVVGPERVVLVDTGTPSSWTAYERQLDAILGGRQIDYIFPTHFEVPHCGNLPMLLHKYPKSIMVGDTRDLHLFFPDWIERLRRVEAGDMLELGGGVQFVFLEAVIRDLPTILWGYETGQRTLFASDGPMTLTHHPARDQDEGMPVHIPGECDLMIREMSEAPAVERAPAFGEGAFYWYSFVEIAPVVEAFYKLLEEYPTRLLCPSHTNVMDGIGQAVAVLTSVHERARRRPVA